MKTAFLSTGSYTFKITGNKIGISEINKHDGIFHTSIPKELELAHKELTEYFQGKRKEFTFNLIIEGTDFQKKVWLALLKIPYGETRSYKDIAISIGKPNASRAVGNANNKNKIAIAIPCHRVIGSNKKLVGYAGGIELKDYLLSLEKQSER
ncbi:methylated-DNA--[protein]-cysteine S-methyltransferase [Mycoplasmatota bacterium]|nr:methylated-DNA--[protein]-cysteine S-methyltransferase [Mycoplasmatota bacterium]